MTFSSEDKFASACDDSTIKVWSISAGRDLPHQQYTSSKMTTCIDFADNDQYMATGHKDGKVRIWDL